jgi:hypothetical protein
MKALLDLIGKTVSRILIYRFPPLFETEINNMDISIGLMLEKSNKVIRLMTDNDCESPLVKIENEPSLVYPLEEYSIREKEWQKGQLEIAEEYEAYDFTKDDRFKDIVGSSIIKVEKIFVKRVEFIGFRLLFSNNFIITFPSSDGSMFETKNFHQGMFNVFEEIGPISFQSIFID